MYAHSNEIDELAVVNLNGVNLERNIETESLLGVRHSPNIVPDHVTYVHLPAETTHLQPIHFCKLIRSFCT